MANSTLILSLKRLLATAIFLLGTSIANGAGEYPRVGVKWHDFKSVMLQRGIGVEEVLSVADAVLISPNPGQMVDDYRQRLSEIRSVNPDLLAFRYMNVTEVIPNAGIFEPVLPVLTDYFVNPNRGGPNKANDGWLREADGEIVNYWKKNFSVNISDYVQAYDGSMGTANADHDLKKPKLGETALDYMTRVNYYTRIRPSEDFIDGVFEDLFRRWPKRKADWDNDGNDESGGRYSSDKVQRMWRLAHLRNRDNIVGKNYSGFNAVKARSNGRAWLQDGGYFIANLSAWSSNTQIIESLDSGNAMERIPEFDQAVFGGVHEGVIGRTNSSGGISSSGTEGDYHAGNLDIALTGFNFRLSHTRSIPSLGYSALLFEAFASNLQMARYAFTAGLLTDGLVNVRTYKDGEPQQPPWVLDEFVGGNIKYMSMADAASNRKWLGAAIDPAYPNNPKLENGRVHLREFENGLVLLLAGKSHRDPHLTTSLKVNLPDAGAGYAWKRISGGQDKSLNNGQIVTGSIRLGTSAANINNNAIILRRVLSAYGPKAPSLAVH